MAELADAPDLKNAGASLAAFATVRLRPPLFLCRNELFAVALAALHIQCGPDLLDAWVGRQVTAGVAVLFTFGAATAGG